MERVEQVKVARWEPLASPAMDELVAASFPDVLWPMKVPVVGTNGAQASLTTKITDVSVDPPLRLVQVSCVWRVGDKGPFTNQVEVLRGPDV
jgi:hypothetical protein